MLKFKKDNYNIDNFKEVYTYKNFKSINKNFIKNGLHRIIVKEGLYVDILIQGITTEFIETNNNKVLVCFSGAVNRSKVPKGPFFSGLTMGKNLNVPIIAISDPTLALDDNLDVSWYAGNELSPNLQKEVSIFLDFISKALNKELVLFGGSAGGFSCLVQATLLTTKAIVFVWNPQTDIEKYSKNFVDQYITTAFPKKKKIIGISDVTQLEINENIRLVYFQNYDDWHLKSHMVPFFTRFKLSFKNDFFNNPKETVQFFIGNFGDNYAGPSNELVLNVLRLLIENNENKNSTSDLRKLLENVTRNFLFWDYATDEFPFYLNIEFDDYKANITVLSNTSIENSKLDYSLSALDKDKVIIDKIDYSSENYFNLDYDHKRKFIELSVRDSFGKTRSKIFVLACSLENIEIDKSYLDEKLIHSDDSFFYRTDYRDKVFTLECANNILDDSPLSLMKSMPKSLFQGYDHEYELQTVLLYINSLRYISFLLDAYYITTEDKYLNKAIEIFKDWRSKEQANTIKNRFLWYDHSVANRVLTLIYLYRLAFKHLSDELKEDIIITLLDHGNWLLDDNNYTFVGNHGVMQDRSLLQLGLFFKESKFQKRAEIRINKSFKRDFSLSGVHSENSTEYHSMMLKMYEEILKMMETSDGKDVFKKAKHYLKLLVKPNGQLPMEGDSGLHILKDEKIYENFYDDEFGNVILNDLDQSFYLFFKAGSKSKIHKHFDDLSFDLTLGNKNVFIDSGKYNYEERDLYRKYIRSPRAHNTIYIEGLEYNFHQNKYESHISHYEETNEYIYTQGIIIIDGDILKRNIIYIDGLLIVLDCGFFTSEKTLHQNFNISNDVIVKDISFNQATIDSNGHEIKIKQHTLDTTVEEYFGDTESIRGFVSEKFNILIPVKQIDFSTTGSKPFMLTEINKLDNCDVESLHFDNHQNMLKIKTTIGSYSIPIINHDKNNEVHVDNKEKTIQDNTIITASQLIEKFKKDELTNQNINQIINLDHLNQLKLLQAFYRLLVPIGYGNKELLIKIKEDFSKIFLLDSNENFLALNCCWNFNDNLSDKYLESNFSTIEISWLELILTGPLGVKPNCVLNLVKENIDSLTNETKSVLLKYLVSDRCKYEFDSAQAFLNNTTVLPKKIISMYNKETLKVAVLVSGQMRGYENSVTRLKEILAGTKTKFFIHTWENNGVNKKSSNKYSRVYPTIFSNLLTELVTFTKLEHIEDSLRKIDEIIFPDALVTETELKESYGPETQIVIEKDRKMSSNHEKMYYKMFKAHELLEESEEFDLYIRIRPDLVIEFNDPFDINNVYNTIKDSNIVFTERGYAYSYYGYGIDDKFSICNKETMKIYSSVWKSWSQNKEKTSLVGHVDLARVLMDNGIGSYSLEKMAKFTFSDSKVINYDVLKILNQLQEKFENHEIANIIELFFKKLNYRIS